MPAKTFFMAHYQNQQSTLCTAALIINLFQHHAQ